MNPEFRRNVWLELTPQRLVIMTGGLGLAFLAVALPGGLEYGPSNVARWLYLLIVVVFGTRSAALSVVGEIRAHTWDSQRLSSLAPASMMWGKLLGSTLYSWYGGILCLAVIVAGVAVQQGVYVAAMDAVYYLALGAVSQAFAFLASLIAIRRRQSVSPLGAFLYQLVGLAAAVIVAIVWSLADPTRAASLAANVRVVDFIIWWGRAFDSRPFLLGSLVVFTAWILVGCYREMRLELQLRNGPFVWLSFLAFIGLYVAGFDAWLPQNEFVRSFEQTGLRLALATTTFVTTTYVMVLLEPKDSVQYRWLLGRLAKRQLGPALGSLQAWMSSYAASFATAAVLSVWLYRSEPGAWDKQALIAAMLGFLTRDVGIFVLVQILWGRVRADLAAIAVLVMLYLLLPAILAGLKLTNFLYVFFPSPSTPVWLGPTVAWSEGLLVAILAIAQLSVRGDRLAAEGSSGLRKAVPTLSGKG